MVRIGSLLRGGKAKGSSGVGLVLINFGKFWVCFKKFQVVSNNFGQFQMVSDSFRLVADSFGWLRVVPDGCGSFAVLVVTCLDLKVNIYIEIPQQLLHFFDPFPISTKNYGKTRLFSTWTKTNVKRTKSLTVPSFWLSTPYFPDTVCLSLLLIPR